LRLRAAERRSRIDFLERLLTGETDTSQPLWPEMAYEKKTMLRRRTEAIQLITRKARVELNLIAVREGLSDFETAHYGDESLETARKILEFRERLNQLERDAEEVGKVVESLKDQLRSLEGQIKCTSMANALVKPDGTSRVESGDS
jgi:hypothetical protein